MLIIVSLASDLADGPIARWMGQATELGARLDTIADSMTLIAGIIGLYVFEFDSLRPDLPFLLLFLGSYAAAAIACLAKFGVLPAYHLFLSKAAAFGAGVFFVWLFMIDYSRPFFLAVLGLGVLANLESLLTTLRLRRFEADITSILTMRSRLRDEDG